MKTRDVKIEYAQGWKKSRLTNKDPGFYNTSTVSILREVPIEISDEELIERWDSVSIAKREPLRTKFHFYYLLDAETTAKEEYRVSEHNKGDWAK